MNEVFDEDELQAVERKRDTEVTLGPMLLLSIFFGLVLLCGLCFGLGYSMGSHGSQNSAAGQQPAAATSLQASAALAKPAAAPPAMSQPPQRAVVSVPPAEVSGSGAGESSTPAASANATQPVVRPALPAPAQVTVPGGAPMVQIAAVSHQEDADVLVAALRKRGYAVAVQHDAADGQYHVRIGPFSNLRDAGATRQKLLNDGYNAIVQP